MTIYRRFLLLCSTFVLVTILLVFRSKDNIKSAQIWRNAPQMVGLGEWSGAGYEDQENINRPSDESENSGGLQEFQEGHTTHSDQSSVDLSSFKPGEAKIHGSTYSKAVVMGHLLSENTTWLDAADLPSHISKFIYVTEPVTSSSSSVSSFLQVPKPKGHEAMVYLTYIIDHYDTLADVNIFLHAHQHAWHNNEMLNHDAVEMIKRLSSERVTREGYMNLRCHSKPGCPEYIHPGVVRADINKQEEGAMASAWSIMFPHDPIPSVIASSCCAQFAVSRARIRSIPLSRFRDYRDWLLATPLNDYVSGRVFEYLWHKIFTDQATFCPDMRACYCDGYGVCFEDEAEFDRWFELKWRKRTLEQKLEKWAGLVDGLEGTRERGRKDREFTGFGRGRSAVQALEEEDLVIPVVDADVVLRRQIDRIRVVLEEKRLAALEAGTDPRVRARVAGRVWKDGDGY